MQSTLFIQLLRLIRLTLFGAIILFAAVYILQHYPTLFSPKSVEPRTITPRGALTESEQTTIAIFEQASPSVVNISTIGRRVNPWTRDVTRVPRGSGSGFFWDEHSFIVANHHVLAGAS